METFEDKTPGDPIDPIEVLRGGDSQALVMLFDKYRDRLRRMVELRLDLRLRARLDASDVVQEAFYSLDPIDREMLATTRGVRRRRPSCVSGPTPAGRPARRSR